MSNRHLHVVGQGELPDVKPVDLYADLPSQKFESNLTYLDHEELEKLMQDHWTKDVQGIYVAPDSIEVLTGDYPNNFALPFYWRGETLLLGGDTSFSFQLKTEAGRQPTIASFFFQSPEHPDSIVGTLRAAFVGNVAYRGYIDGDYCRPDPDSVDAGMTKAIHPANGFDDARHFHLLLELLQKSLS